MKYIFTCPIVGSMTKKLSPAQAFKLADAPERAALVADFRAAALEDSGYSERIARAAATIVAKRGTMPDRSEFHD